MAPQVVGAGPCRTGGGCNRFHHDLDDRDGMIEAYLRHNDTVRAEVPPGRLIDWTAGDGWEPLCAVLGLPVPDEGVSSARSSA